MTEILCLAWLLAWGPMQAAGDADAVLLSISHAGSPSVPWRCLRGEPLNFVVSLSSRPYRVYAGTRKEAARRARGRREVLHDSALDELSGPLPPPIPVLAPGQKMSEVLSVRLVRRVEDGKGRPDDVVVLGPEDLASAVDAAFAWHSRRGVALQQDGARGSFTLPPSVSRRLQAGSYRLIVSLAHELGPFEKEGPELVVPASAQPLDRARAHLQRGYHFCARGDRALALVELRLSLDVHRTYNRSEALYHIARIHESSGEDALALDAMREYQAAVAQPPWSPVGERLIERIARLEHKIAAQRAAKAEGDDASGGRGTEDG